MDLSKLYSQVSSYTKVLVPQKTMNKETKKEHLDTTSLERCCGLITIIDQLIYTDKNIKNLWSRYQLGQQFYLILDRKYTSNSAFSFCSIPSSSVKWCLVFDTLILLLSITPHFCSAKLPSALKTSENNSSARPTTCLIYKQIKLKEIKIKGATCSEIPKLYSYMVIPHLLLLVPNLDSHS